MRRTPFILVGFLVIVGFVAYDIFGRSLGPIVEPNPVIPDWSAISSWPRIDADTIEAVPDPNRRITAVVFDDSGSMGNSITDAKQAVVEALAAMEETDRVAVVALNSGVILPFMSVSEARSALGPALGPVASDGSTPLTAAVQTAQAMLEAEAAMAQSFGTYQLIVTTDGQADDGDALVFAVEELARSTPIQLATIGISVSGSHVLRRTDIGNFVDVSNAAALAGALQAAVAENADFDAITDFTEGN